MSAGPWLGAYRARWVNFQGAQLWTRETHTVRAKFGRTLCAQAMRCSRKIEAQGFGASRYRVQQRVPRIRDPWMCKLLDESGPKRTAQGPWYHWPSKRLAVRGTRNQVHIGQVMTMGTGLAKTVLRIRWRLHSAFAQTSSITVVGSTRIGFEDDRSRTKTGMSDGSIRGHRSRHRETKF